MATYDPVSWNSVVSEPYDGDPMDYHVNARFARDAIMAGRGPEILALNSDDGTCNILDAALFHCVMEIQFHLTTGEVIEHEDHGGLEGRFYAHEHAQLLCRELVKLGMTPVRMVEVLTQSNRLYTSSSRAAYAQAAFDAGLIQQLREVRVGRRELFLTDLPMHIVLSIGRRGLSTIGKRRLLEYMGGMVDALMAHGLSTRLAAENIIKAIENNDDVVEVVVDDDGDIELEVLEDEEYEETVDLEELLEDKVLEVRKSRTYFLKQWRHREVVFSRQRAALIQKLSAQAIRCSMPSSVLASIDAFLLGDFVPVLRREIRGIGFDDAIA